MVLKRFLAALLIVSWATLLPQSAQAEYLDAVPSTEACDTMKNDIDPNMDSSENREGVESMFQDVFKEGRQGRSCSTLRSRKSQLASDSSLNLTGSSKYSKERVFAWGKLCLLDWCNVEPGNSKPSNNGDDDPSTPASPQGIPDRPAPPRPTPPPSKYFNLTICNTTDSDLYVAYI